MTTQPAHKPQSLRILTFVAVFVSMASLLLMPQARAQPVMDDVQETFRNIWSTNFWDDATSRSGPGSALVHTQSARENISRIIKERGITSITDAACGDFGWMSQVDRNGASYLGMDIVPELIDQLQAKHAQPDGSIRFLVGNIAKTPIPKADLVIARDVIGHLDFVHGLAALQNIKKSGARWLLSTTFSESRENWDITNGGWRPVNLVGEPYLLGRPVELIREGGVEAGTALDDKFLALWDLSKLID